MFKITQTYEDFDGNTRTDDLYFNFTEPQLRKFLDEEPAFTQKNLAELMVTKDAVKMIDALQTLIVAAYGEKSADGRSFIKNKEIQENFEGSAAFAQLMDDLMYKGDSKMVEDFLVNIFPAKFAGTIREEMTKASRPALADPTK